MLQKHKRILILLTALVYVYSVCPILCATFEEKVCHNTPQEILTGDIGTESTCCQKADTDAARESDTSSENGKLCCTLNLELIPPDDTHNRDNVRESSGQHLVSTVPSAVIPPISPAKLPQLLSLPTLYVSPPNCTISRRGPPYTHV